MHSSLAQLAPILAALVARCSAAPVYTPPPPRHPRGYPTLDELDHPEQIDLSGIERNEENTDVIAEYWSRSFSSLGKQDTFQLFARKYALLSEEDPVEAEAALRGFRRLCRLRGSLDSFDSFWAAKSGRTLPGDVSPASTHGHHRARLPSVAVNLFRSSHHGPTTSQNCVPGAAS